MSRHYELTSQPRLGPGPDDAKEGLVLNRVIRWTATGIAYEADPRQAERLIAEVLGENGGNPVVTPATPAKADELNAEQPLASHLQSAYHGSAARGNYLASDRPDIQLPTKEVCRWMAEPTDQSYLALKRLARFLCGAPRLVYHYTKRNQAQE